MSQRPMTSSKLAAGRITCRADDADGAADEDGADGGDDDDGAGRDEGGDSLPPRFVVRV